MKDLHLLVWLTQLGLSVVLPLVGFILLGLWLQNYWGQWVVFAGIGLGIISAIDGLRTSLKAMERLTKGISGDTPPPVSFNDHD